MIYRGKEIATFHVREREGFVENRNGVFRADAPAFMGDTFDILRLFRSFTFGREEEGFRKKEDRENYIRFKIERVARIFGRIVHRFLDDIHIGCDLFQLPDVSRIAPKKWFTRGRKSSLPPGE